MSVEECDYEAYNDFDTDTSECDCVYCNPDLHRRCPSCNHIDLDSSDCDSDNDDSDMFFTKLMMLEREKWNCK
jgi:hypothetical protein